MIYGKDLPGNLGNTDILRAIYDKQEELVQKLDSIIVNVNETKLCIIQNNNAISETNQSLNNVANNVNTLNNTNSKGFLNVVSTIKQNSQTPQPHSEPKPLPAPQPKPQPKPQPPCPPIIRHQPQPPLPKGGCYNVWHPEYEYMPNVQDVHAHRCFNPNLSEELEKYLEEVRLHRRKFNAKEFHSLPHPLPPMYIPIFKAVYNNMIYHTR